MTTRTVSKEFTVETKSGKTVTCEVQGSISHDPAYGSDADGRRGVPMDFFEDVQLVVPITDPGWDKDDDDKPLTEEEKKEAEELLIHAAEQDTWEEWDA